MTGPLHIAAAMNKRQPLALQCLFSALDKNRDRDRLFVTFAVFEGDEEDAPATFASDNWDEMMPWIVMETAKSQNPERSERTYSVIIRRFEKEASPLAYPNGKPGFVPYKTVVGCFCSRDTLVPMTTKNMREAFGKRFADIRFAEFETVIHLDTGDEEVVVS